MFLNVKKIHPTLNYSIFKYIFSPKEYHKNANLWKKHKVELTNKQIGALNPRDIHDHFKYMNDIFWLSRYRDNLHTFIDIIIFYF